MRKCRWRADSEELTADSARAATAEWGREPAVGLGCLRPGFALGWLGAGGLAEQAYAQRLQASRRNPPGHTPKKGGPTSR